MARTSPKVYFKTVILLEVWGFYQVLPEGGEEGLHPLV